MRRFKRLIKAEGGFTLAETLIAIGIMTTCLTMVGVPLTNALRHDEDWRAGITAVTTLQSAHARMGKDVVNAETVSLADGADPVNGLTLTWHDLEGTPHTAIYSLTGTELVRDLDGGNLIVGRNVSSVEFSRSANVMTFTIAVHAASGTIESKTSTFFLRSLE